MYTPEIPACIIDLFKDEPDRWAEVIRRDKQLVLDLIEEAKEDFPVIPDAVIKGAGWLFNKVYGLSGGRYRGEMSAWSDALGITPGEVALLNCTYELSHVGERLFGCTAGVRWVEGLGMVHVRSMDWPLSGIGPATRLFHFIDGGREHYSVGISGYVSVLSGMVPGAYSVTINWAPPTSIPTFDWGPSFLLRETLETCQSYDEAVEVLANTRLSTSVFFTVCGVRRGQACVIERTRKATAIRKPRRGVLVQANHHVAPAFQDNNASGFDADTLKDSRLRAFTLEEELSSLKGASSLEEVAACLDVSPVCNEQSYQQMAFCPGSGEVRAWRWVEE